MSEDGDLGEDWGEDSFDAPSPPPKPAASPAHAFEALTPQLGGKAVDGRPLDFILDIPLEVSVELGRTKMVINDLLQLGQGSVIELTKLAGEPLEILVNNKLVARGEVVVVNEKFGVRVTDIVSPMERVKSLS
ncbi:MAG: flagellar motor switch protein FliN [Proteobacteria bacterium]|nr:flagellar motor switch protein FliN [Pseudomonadota bacterium]